MVTEPLSPDSLYVVAPAVAGAIEVAHKGLATCNNLDSFIVCSSKAITGLPPDSSIRVTPVENALKNAGFEAQNILPWAPSSSQAVEPRVSADYAHGGAQSLEESGGESGVYQDATELTPGHTYTVSAWVMGSPGASSMAQLEVYDPDANMTTFSPWVQIFPQWQLLSVPATENRAGRLQVRLLRNNGTGTVYWDDVNVEEVQ